MAQNTAGTNGNHVEHKPIGPNVEGHLIESFQLRDRRLMLRLDGNVVLEVYAPGRPLSLRLTTPDGVLEE